MGDRIFGRYDNILKLKGYLRVDRPYDLVVEIGSTKRSRFSRRHRRKGSAAAKSHIGWHRLGSRPWIAGSGPAMTIFGTKLRSPRNQSYLLEIQGFRSSDLRIISHQDGRKPRDPVNVPTDSAEEPLFSNGYTLFLVTWLIGPALLPIPFVPA